MPNQTSWFSGSRLKPDSDSRPHMTPANLERDLGATKLFFYSIIVPVDFSCETSQKRRKKRFKKGKSLRFPHTFCKLQIATKLTKSCSQGKSTSQPQVSLNSHLQNFNFCIIWQIKKIQFICSSQMIINFGPIERALLHKKRDAGQGWASGLWRELWVGDRSQDQGNPSSALKVAGFFFQNQVAGFSNIQGPSLDEFHNMRYLGKTAEI